MSRANKYRAKQVYYDLEAKYVLPTEEVEKYRIKGKLHLPPWINRFDSQHEFRVYLKLVDIYGERRVHLQVPLEIFSKSLCHPNGKYWKVDFRITSKANLLQPLLYVEAKGALTKEFELILSALEQNNYEAFNSLYIVFPDKIPAGNKLIKSLLKTDFNPRIYRRTQFNQLHQLL